KHRPQTQDRKYVGEKDDVGILGYGKDRWNRIHCENQIGKLNHQQDEEKRCDVFFSCFFVEELTAHKGGIDREIPGSKLHHRMVLWIDLFFIAPVQKHIDTCVNQEKAEDVKYPSKLADERSAQKYDKEPKDDGSDDSPHRDFVIVFRGHAKR